MSEIIIDGVDVRGCEYYKGKCMEYTHYCQIGCKECTDIGTKLCHYKQTEKFKAKIARLEQENKQMKSALEEIKNDLKEVCKEECDYTKAKFCGDCDCRYGQILNKINEVLEIGKEIYVLQEIENNVESK